MATHARRPPASDEALQAQLSAACTAVLKEYVRGGVHRAKAKKALIKLTKEHESCYTPHRFLARVLYHEAAVLEARQQGPAAPGSLPAGGALGRERLELLQSALEHAKIATQLNPSSASSAALRATLVVNVLVEESTLFTRSGTASADAIKKEFQEAMAACSQAANAANPTLAEPVINISDDGSQTCDPCSLRVQDQILQWVRAGRWDCVIQEKRNVLVCMQQVLQSCHTLLDSTQIPVDGVVRLLQHILRSLLPHRPLQHDLQVWASQLLGNPAASLPESQLLLQAQQTLLKQGHQLQQPGSCTLDPPPATVQEIKAAGTAPVSSTSSPTPAMQQGPAPGAAKPRPPVAGVPPPGSARPQGPMISAPPAVLHPGMSLALPLFEARDWDWDKELGGASAAASTGGVAQPVVAAGQAAARRRTKGKVHGKPQAANNTRSKERSRKERYTDVEAFWVSLNPWQRNEYLRVPLGPLLQRLRLEAGQEVLDDVCEGLAMLQERNLHTNCVWTCVMCNQKFTHAKDFLQHIEVAHEEVAVQGGKYVMCGKCQVDVVGMYYTSTCVADYSLCARCFQQELASVPEISSAYERIYPRVPSVNGPQRWSDSGSDFISTRDSFTSMEELDQLEGPATPKAVRLEGGSHWTPPGPKAGPMPAGDRPHGLPAWAASAVQQHECSPTSRQHSSSSTASAPSSPTIATAAPVQGEAAPQGSPSPESRAQQQHERSFSSPAHLHSGPEPRTRSDPPRTQQGDGSAAEGGLLSSWWPRRLLQSWNSTGQPETGKHGSSRDDAGSEKGAGSSGCEGVVPVARSFSSPEPAPSTPPPVGSHVVAASSSRTEGMVRRSSSRSSAASTAQSARRNSPIGSTKSPVAEDGAGVGAGAASVLPSSCGSCGTTGSTGACADCMLSVGLDATASVAMLCGSERRQLVVVVDEIMQRVRDIYGANHAVGDMALGSIMQFTERKISALLKQHILPSQAPSVRPQLEEFLAQPACVFRKPEVLRGTLRCLTLTDLHMVLVYVVRQHAEAAASAVSPANTSSKGTGGMPRAAAATTHYMGSTSAADGQQTTGHPQARQSVLAPTGLPQHLGGGLLLEDDLYDDDDVTEEEDVEDEDNESIESSCKCDECEEDEDEQDEEDEEEEEEEEEEDEDDDDVAPPPVLELHVPEKVVFQALMVDAWHRDKEGDGDFVTVGDGSAMIKLPPMRIPEAMGLNPIVVIMEGGKPLEYDLRRHPWFSPAQWWISHLLDHPPTTMDAPAPLRSGLGPRRVLQWVFGRYVNAAAEDFLQRQRDYRAGRERDAALLDLYDDLAYGWRSLQAALDQRARLEELRKGARAQFAVVRHIEEEARHCHAEEAAEFLEVLMASHQAAMDAARAAGNPTELPRLNMCEAAVDVVRRHPALAGEPSQRYARALLDRELSALLLVEAMLAAEVDEASRARTASEDTLRKHRSEARENEAEYTRLEAEGPACHRKKDMLDKATKEAEHRERLQDLQQRLIAVTERIAAEDANKNKATDRLAEAERDLRAVRDQLCQHSTRRKHLDELCAQLEVPMPPALMHQQQQQSTAAAAMGMPLQPSYSPITATVTVPYPSDMSPPGEPSRPTNPDFASPPAAAMAPVAPATPASEPTASAHTAPPAPQAPTSPANQALTSSPTTPFASPPPVPVFLPAIPSSSTEHLASPASPTPTALPASLSSPTALLLAPGREMPSGHALASAVTLEEWHKQRLEVLMYRLMWVSEAVKSFQDQYSSHARTRHYELFLKATSWAKSLADEYEQQVRGWYNELDKLRDKLLEQSCWDIGLMLGPHLLEIIRRRIEHGARQAQEKASLSLLEELEAEESHTSKGKASAGGAGTGAAGAAGAGVTASTGTVAGAAAGGKNANKNAARKQKVADKAREKKEREEAEKQARLAESEARRRAEEEERLRLAEARRAREVAIDAELERRRQELEGLEALREAEAIHAAQEASLREAARAAAVREQQQQQYEASMQQALQEAKAAQAAAALARQQAQAAGTVAAPPPTATANAGRQLGTVRNGMRSNATAETAAVKVTPPQAQGSNMANGVATAAHTANTNANAAVTAKAAKPGTLRAQIREAQGANPAAAARQHQQRTSTALPPAALTARSSSSSTVAEPAVPDAVAVPPPRAPANKHAPKFTSPAVVAANHARNAASYAAGRGSSAPADGQKPAALQQQGQHSNAAAMQQQGKAVTGGRHVANAPHTSVLHNSVAQANVPPSHPPHTHALPANPAHANAPPNHPPHTNTPLSNGPYTNAPHANAPLSHNPRNGAPHANAPHNNILHNSVPLANGHASLHPYPHANGHELHDVRHAPTANGGPAAPGLAGAHQRGMQVHAASLANSPAATRQPRASLPMPQTPEQRPTPGILATAAQPAPPPPSPATAPQLPAAAAPPLGPGASVGMPQYRGMGAAPSAPQHDTARQVDLLTGLGFNPFAENPLLRALQGAERAVSPAPVSPGLSLLGPTSSPIHAPPPSHGPHPQLTSPRSPGDHLCSPNALGSRPPHLEGGYAFPHHMHHALHAHSPVTPNNATVEPATDHILSIMSILEPDAQSSRSPVAPYAFKSQGSSSLAGSGSAGSTGRQYSQGAANGDQQQQSSAQAGEQQCTPRAATSTVKPVPGQHLLAGLSQGTGGFSIWSHQASEHQGTDAWAMHSAGSTPSAAEVRRGSRDGGNSMGQQSAAANASKPGVVSMLSSAAAPWTGSATFSTSARALATPAAGAPQQPANSVNPQQQQQQQQHADLDMASLLPASLLPASLEPDSNSASLRSSPVSAGVERSANGSIGSGTMRPGLAAEHQHRTVNLPGARWQSEAWAADMIDHERRHGTVPFGPARGMPPAMFMGAAKQHNTLSPGLGPAQRGLMHPYLHGAHMMPNVMWPGHAAAGHMGPQQAVHGLAEHQLAKGWALPYQFPANPNLHANNPQQQQAGPWSHHQ